jgi:outer membrane protein assembly factor BamD
MTAPTSLARAFRRAAIAGLLFAAIGCSTSTPKLPAPNSAEPDKYLFDKGTEALAAKKWFTAREYFRRLVDGYPQSPLRPQAKLGLGDTYLVENSAESKVLAANEYREFLTFFPSDPHADQAQFNLALAHFRQMLNPQRDQTETIETIKQFKAFLDRFSGSTLRPGADKYYRQARDRLSDAGYEVGLFYYRIKNYAGSIDRFKEVLRADPEYSRRDALYFYMGESLAATKHLAEALPYYDRIVKEFVTSEYLEKAKKRIEELKR